MSDSTQRTPDLRSDRLFSPLSRRSFLAKSALATGALAGAGALLDACGGSSSGSVTLQVMYDDGAELSKKYAALYHQQNPNITIKVLQPDQTRLNAMFAAGGPPDIVRVVGATDMPSFAARGLATDLTPYLNKSSMVKVSDLQPINDVFRWDGKQQGQGPYYGLTKDWSVDTQFWYNKKLFDQAGIAYPDPNKPLSYAELLDLGKRLTVRQGDKIQVYGLDTAWEFGFTYTQIVAMLAQSGASLFNADLTKADFTQPEVKKVLQWFVDWAQARVGPSPLDVGSTAFDLFNADRLAIVTFGYWFGGGYIGVDTKGLSDHVGLAPTPQWGTTRTTACFSATGFFIPQASKNKDAAWKFIEWFAGGQPGVDHSKQGFGIPPLKSLFQNLPTGTAWQQQATTSVKSDLADFKALRFTPYASSGAVSTAIQTALEPVIKGQGSVDSAAQQLNTTVNLLLQQGASQAG